MIGNHTRRKFLMALMTVPFFPALEAEAKPDRLNVVDYFRMVPEGDGFEAAPSSLLDIMQGGRNLVDKANGYLRCEGDGAQASFEVALFRYQDDRPLLAVCLGELEGADSQYLEFFVPGPKGKMRKAPRSIFPVADGAGRQFILPRNGRTVVVRDKSGKRERRFVWDGARFVEEK